MPVPHRPLPIASLAVPVASLLALVGLAVAASIPQSEAAIGLAFAALLIHRLRTLPTSQQIDRLPRKRLALAAAGLFVGWAIGSWLLIAVGWMHLSRSFITRHFDEQDRRVLRPWWPVAIMAVPWVWADAWWLGWQMRLTSAAAAQSILTPMLPDLSRLGTSLLVNGVEIDVAASCAGLGLLQTVLMLGMAGVAMGSRSAVMTVASVPMLVAIAWATNVVRVALLTLVAVFGSPELASRTLHDLIGYGLLAILAWLGWTAFDRLRDRTVATAVPS